MWCIMFMFTIWTDAQSPRGYKCHHCPQATLNTEAVPFEHLGWDGISHILTESSDTFCERSIEKMCFNGLKLPELHGQHTVATMADTVAKSRVEKGLIQMKQ